MSVHGQRRQGFAGRATARRVVAVASALLLSAGPAEASHPPGDPPIRGDLLVVVDGAQNALYAVAFPDGTLVQKFVLRDPSGGAIAARARGVGVESEAYRTDVTRFRDLDLTAYVSFDDGSVFHYRLVFATGTATALGRFTLDPPAYRLDSISGRLLYTARDNKARWVWVDCCPYSVRQTWTVTAERPQAPDVPQEAYQLEGITAAIGGYDPHADRVTYVNDAAGEGGNPALHEHRYSPYLYQYPYSTSYSRPQHAIVSTPSLGALSLLQGPETPTTIPEPADRPKLTSLWREAPMAPTAEALAGTYEPVPVTVTINGVQYTYPALESYPNGTRDYALYARSGGTVRLLREKRALDMNIVRHSGPGDDPPSGYVERAVGLASGNDWGGSWLYGTLRVETLKGSPSNGWREGRMEISRSTPDIAPPFYMHVWRMSGWAWRMCTYPSGTGASGQGVPAGVVLTTGDTFLPKAANDSTMVNRDWVKLSSIPPRLAPQDFIYPFGEPPACGGSPEREELFNEWSLDVPWYVMARSASSGALWLNGMAYDEQGSLTLPAEITDPQDIDVVNLDPQPEPPDLQIHLPGGAPVLDADEVSKGGQLYLNDDNDDRDASTDLADDAVPGEDDLVEIVAKVPSGTGTLSLTSAPPVDPPKVRLWMNPDRTGEVTLPLSLTGTRTFWAEGVQGSSAQRDVSLRLQAVFPNGAVLQDDANLTVLKVQNVTFIGRGNSAGDGNALDANNHPSGILGSRVFPDARLEQGAPGARRDKVTVRVRLNVPAVYPADVFLRPFDVDDPSLGMGFDPPGPVDNKGEAGVPGGPKRGALDGQDGVGISRLTFTPTEQSKDLGYLITMQPGDNFRVAAAFDRDLIAMLRNSDDDGDAQEIVDPWRDESIPTGQSEVLTVWRKLHLELDTMERAGAAVVLDADDDRNVLPRQPDIARVNAYFDDAYIMARDDLGPLDARDNVTFDAHTTDAEAMTNAAGAPCFERRDERMNADSFWVVYVLSVFQGQPTGDGDPETDGWELGFMPPFAGVDRNCAILYQENIADIIRPVTGSPIALAGGFTQADIERATVVHEIGHTLGAMHNHKEIMNDLWPQSYQDLDGNGRFDSHFDRVNPIPTRFHETSVDAIRSTRRPGV